MVGICWVTIMIMIININLTFPIIITIIKIRNINLTFSSGLPLEVRWITFIYRVLEMVTMIEVNYHDKVTEVDGAAVFAESPKSF